jgi:IS30 family transposase
MKEYTQLTLSERYKIETSLYKGVSVSLISKIINRDRSTIYNEISRDSVKGSL